MTRTKTTRAGRPSENPPGLITPEELFLPVGEDVIEDFGPPLSEEERFRERVWQAWAVIKVTRFREEEHERLARVLGEMIAEKRNQGVSNDDRR